MFVCVSTSDARLAPFIVSCHDYFRCGGTVQYNSARFETKVERFVHELLKKRRGSLSIKEGEDSSQSKARNLTSQSWTAPRGVPKRPGRWCDYKGGCTNGCHIWCRL